MKAVVIKEYGDRSKLVYTDIDKPNVGEGEVLIRIKAAGVNPVDTKIRQGYLRTRSPNIFPIILGWDLAGVIEETGHGARRFSPRDEVFAYARRTVIQNGTYAEYISLPESYVTFKPRNLSFEQAASVPLASLTAYQTMFDKGKLIRGENVLIIGASGGVGSFAVQFAKIMKAKVYAVASGRRETYLRQLGADYIIDYTRDDFKDQFRKLLPSGADLVLDYVGGDFTNKAYECAKPNGILVSIISQLNEQLAIKYNVNFKYWFVEPNVTQLDKIREWIETEKVKVYLQKVYDLKDVEKAHAQIETAHTQGKVVLKVS